MFYIPAVCHLSRRLVKSFRTTPVTCTIKCLTYLRKIVKCRNALAKYFFQSKNKRAGYFYPSAHFTAFCCSYTNTHKTKVREAIATHLPIHCLKCCFLRKITIGMLRLSVTLTALRREGMICLQDRTRWKGSALFHEDRKERQRIMSE